MKLLKPGDPCPCCGQPIKSRDPDVLELLTRIAQEQRFPTIEEIRAWRKEGNPCVEKMRLTPRKPG